MPERGIPPDGRDVVERIEVIPRSDTRHALLVRDQLAALAALITTPQEHDHAAEQERADAHRVV